MTQNTFCSNKNARVENNIDLCDTVYRKARPSFSVLMIGELGASTALLRASLARFHCAADLVTISAIMLLLREILALQYDGIVIDLDSVSLTRANDITRIIHAQENYRTIPIFGVTNMTLKRGCGAGVQRIEMKWPPWLLQSSQWLARFFRIFKTVVLIKDGNEMMINESKKIMATDPVEAPLGVVKYVFSKQSNPFAKVLLVTPQNNIVSLLGNQLENRYGCAVDVMPGIAELPTRLIHHPYHLLLIDLELVGVIETVGLLREKIVDKVNMPILGLTTQALGDADKQQYLATGMQGILSWPVTPSDLKDILLTYVFTIDDPKGVLNTGDE